MNVRGPFIYLIVPKMANSTCHNPLPGHLASLDGVRGIAILMVLIHTTNILRLGSDPLGNVVARIAGMGWVGVQLFFVLSGFLITRTLLHTQSSSCYFRTFYGRRVLRIFPLYYATLLFFFAFLPLIGHAPQAVQDDVPHQIWLWLFLSNWTEWIGFGGLSLPHFWSLAVEEQFYLIWPVVMYRRTPKEVLRVCGYLAITSLMTRCIMVFDNAPPLVIYTSSICRMDALAFGAAVAAWTHLPNTLNIMIRSRGRILWAMALLFLIGRLIPNGFGMVDAIGQTLGYTLLSGIFALSIAATVAGECLSKGIEQSLLKSSWLRSLGKYSFAIYVFHAPLNSYVGATLAKDWGWAEHPTTAQGLIYLFAIGVCAFAMAWVSYQLMERHFLRLKRLFSA